MRAEIELVAHVVMPNHLHALMTIIPPDTDIPGFASPVDVGAHGRAPAPTTDSLESRMQPLRRPPRSLGSFVGGFKAAAARAVNDLHGTPGQTFWQRGYHDRVIRNDREFGIVAEYIATNPARWAMDRENPERSA